MEDSLFWDKLFQDAGLSPQNAKKYARLFVENRITLDHLRFLDKDLLKEMGIIAVGDIIAILQCFKTIDLEKLSETNNLAAVTSTTPLIEKPIIPPGHEVPVPTKRRVSKQVEGSYKIKLPEGKTEKTRTILRKMGLSVPDMPISTRTVVITAAPSSTMPSTTHVAKRTGSKYTNSLLDDDSDEDFEVTISSSSPDARISRTHRFGNIVNAKPNLGNQGSVFDRLGAEPPSDSIKSHKSPPSTGKSVLSRIVDRTLSSQAAEAQQAQQRLQRFSSCGNLAKKGGIPLKRVASDSVFSRLGNGSPKKLRPSFQENGADDALPYQGVLKQSRLSDRVQPFTRPTNATTFAAKASTSLAVGRISVKDRLGSVSSDEIPPNYQSAGVLAGGQVPKSVHERLGTFSQRFTP